MWLAIWSRAVIVPAARRAFGLWAGAIMAAAILFGGTGMRASDLTGLAIGDPGVGAGLALTWLLVFVPVARGLVRADGARYLRSLPGPPRATRALTALALVGLQLPWLALWTIGDGLRGGALVAIWTCAIAAVAAWRPRPPSPRDARWRSGPAALRGLYARALARRAGEAVVRGAGVAVLAGVAAGLLVRHNALVDADAAVLGAAAIAIVGIAAPLGARLALLDAHRQSAWLAATLGLSARARLAALAVAVFALDASVAVLAVTAATVAGALDGMTAAWLALAVLGVATAATIGGVRTLARAADAPTVATRVVVGAATTAGITVIALGLLGLVGLIAALATVAVLAVRR